MRSGYSAPRWASRGRRLAASAAVMVAALMALAGGASNAAAAIPANTPLPQGFLGITPNLVAKDYDLAHIRETGSTTVRYALSWAVVQEHRGGRFNWSHADRFVVQASRAGLSVNFMISTTPRWAANPLNPSIWDNPIGTQIGKKGWGRFIAAAVRRYGHDGTFWKSHHTIPYRPVTWTIWNEPNLQRFWTTPRASDFAKLMNYTGPIIRHADAKATIVAGGVFCQFAWQTYLDHFYRVVDKSSFDALAIHPYNDSPYRSVGLMAEARQIMNAAGDRGTPIWVDEISWGTDLTKKSKRFITTPSGQAQNIRILFQILAYERQRLGVEKVLWFGIRDNAGIFSCNFCGSSGLFNPDNTPKPSWFAFKGFGAQAAGAITGGVENKRSRPKADEDVYLDLNGNDSYDVGDPLRTTGEDGSFRFPALYATSYAVRMKLHRGEKCIDPADCTRTVQVKAGQTVGGQQFIVGPDRPNTKIKKKKINSRKHKAKFKFKAIGGESPYKFKCKLDHKRWKKCKKRKTFKHLKPGKHKLRVRAKSANGLKDKSPAKKKFKIKGHHHRR